MDSDTSSISDAYDHLAPGYDAIYRDHESEAEDRVVASLVGIELRRRLDLGFAHGPARVLDVGCGTGWLLSNLPSAGAGPYDGIDLSAGMLEVAREKHEAARLGVGARRQAPRRFLQGSLHGAWRDTVGVNAWYDLIVSTYCSPSYTTPRHFAAQAAEVLRPGGRLFAMPHGEGNDERPEHLPSTAYTPAPGEHYAPWRAAETLDALMAEGFVDLAIRGFRHPTKGPRPDASLQRHLWYLARENLTVASRRRPDDFTFLVVTGTYRP